MTITETSDYTQFKKHPANRDIDEKSRDRLVEAIQKKNLLKSHPIVVDKEFYIIDGQHRLEACKKLQIPVTYVMDENITTEDIIALNTNRKSWNMEDFLNFYVSKHRKDYILLDEFIRREKIHLNIALRLLNGNRNGAFYEEYKNGSYKFPSPEELEDVLTKQLQINQVINYIKTKTSGLKTYLDRVTFYGAMVDFFNIKSFEFEVFMTKLQYRIDLMHACTRQNEYVKLFKDIYNWKNKRPLVEDTSDSQE